MRSPVKLSDGIIKLNSARGRVFGFTSDAYDGWLWKKGGAIYISFIVSKSNGNFKRLIDRIRALGFAIKIPTPLGHMQKIVEKNGYRYTVETDPKYGPCEVWVLDAPIPQRETQGGLPHA